MISAKQLSKRIGRSLRTLRRWKVQGYGPKPIVHMHRVWYDENEVEKWERGEKCRNTSYSVLSPSFTND